MLIYKNQYGRWSIYCANEYQGERNVCYLPISFKRGLEPIGDKEMIEVTKFIPSCYKNKDGVVQPKLIVTDYVIVKPSETQHKVEVDLNDLPF